MTAEHQSQPSTEGGGVASSGLRRRLLTGILALGDFGANSLTTLVLSFMAAKALGLNDFGSFGVAMNLALFAQAVVQGGLIDVVMRERDGFQPQGLWSIERWFALVTPTAVLSLAAGVLWWRPALLVTGVCVGYLYVRTFWVRAFLVSAGRAHDSAVRSLLSLGIAAAGFAATRAWHVSGWLPVLAVHILAYALPTAPIHWKLRRAQRERTRDARYWNFTYAVENLILMGALQLSSVVATPFLGLSFSAGLRAASILMGPLNVVFSGARLLLMPYLAGRRRSLRAPLAAAAAMGVLCVAWFFVALVIVRNFGDAVLGSSAGMARQYMVWVGVTYITQGCYMVLFVAGRAYLADLAVRMGRMTEVSIVVIGTALACIFRSPWAYFGGNAISMVVAGTVLTAYLRRHLRVSQDAIAD